MAEQPKKKRANSKKKNRRISGRVLFYGAFFTVVVAIVCGIIGYLLIILNGERLLAEHGSKLNLGEASIIYDAGGNEIARLSVADHNRDIAEFAEIPKHMLEAIVATEDQRFYEHSGIDFWAIGRALVKDIIARSAVEGGSTITQQLAKNVFLTADKTLFRKATEASIAVALEQKMTKDEILAMYLNRIYYGKGVSGIKAAANYYFDTELEDLELWQAATLAAMPKAPNRFNPLNNPEASMNRRAVVLKLMYDQGYISEAEMEEAKKVVYEPPANLDDKKTDIYPAFVDLVIEEAVEVMKLKEEELRIGGFHIYTTLNKQAQDALDREFNNDDNFETSVDEQKVQGAMIIMDHRDGSIQALSGGRDYVKKGLNRVNVKRQPGSAIKPIVSYGPALETGQYFPWTTLKNDKKCFSNYCPTDSWGAASVTMTQAMKDSRNLAAVWMLNEIGIKKSFEFAEKLGIEFEKDDYNLTAALGGLTKGATPMQMATAFSVMANGGKSVDPHSITKIEGRNKSKKYEYEAPAPTQLMSPQTAWYLTEMMLKVVEKGGTGTRAAIDRPVAGKTGTTQHGLINHPGDRGIRDAWFVGYTAEWTAAVWMGYDKTDANHLLKKGSAQSAAMFAKVMQPALKGVEKSSFKKPQGTKENKPPAKVTNLNAVYIPEEMKVELSWDALSNKNITYEVYRKEINEQEYTHFDTRTTTGVVDISVFPGLTYDYYVVAYDPSEDLESAPSNIVRVHVEEPEQDIPDIPMDPTPSFPSDGEDHPPVGGEDGWPDDGDEGAENEDSNNGEAPEGTEPPDEGIEIIDPFLPPLQQDNDGAGNAGTEMEGGGAGNL